MSEHSGVETSINNLKSEHEETRHAALLALADAVKSTDYAAQETIVWAVGDYAARSKDQFAIQIMKDAIEHPNFRVRNIAVTALQWIDSEQTATFLIQVLQTHPNSNARDTAAERLGTLIDSRAVKPLAEALFDPESHVQSSAHLGLKHLQHGGYSMSDLVEYLIAKLNDSDPQIRQLAARWLGSSQDERALEPLVNSLLYDEMPAVRASAAMSIARLKDQRAVDPLITALTDSASSEIGKVCDHAAGALGEIRDTRAVEPLILALKNGCEGAAGGLGAIGDSRAVDPLITAFRQGNFTAAFALATLNDSTGIDALLDALQSEHQEQYIAAYSALQRVTDPRVVEALEAFHKTKQFAEMDRLAADVMRQIAKIAADVGKNLNK